jgi:hypothetical protein
MPTAKLLAEFHLDGDGKPVFTLSGGKKHYQIDLFVTNAPTEAYCVTYQLDDSYVVPKRIVPRTVPEFRESITSYGDYDINVMVLTKKHATSPSIFSSDLSRALMEKYNPSPPAEIQNAIQDILDN